MANTITFVEETPNPSKGFRIGRVPSLFVNGAEFQITGYKVGSYIIDGQSTKYSGVSQSILFKTSLEEDLNLNRVLRGRRVIYDADGKASIHLTSTFGADLEKHLLTLGRRDDNPELLKGTVDDAGKKAIEFFNGKTISVVGEPCFDKDDKGHLVQATAIQFRLK